MTMVGMSGGMAGMAGIGWRGNLNVRRWGQWTRCAAEVGASKFGRTLTLALSPVHDDDADDIFSQYMVQIDIDNITSFIVLPGDMGRDWLLSMTAPTRAAKPVLLAADTLSDLQGVLYAVTGRKYEPTDEDYDDIHENIAVLRNSLKNGAGGVGGIEAVETMDNNYDIPYSGDTTKSSVISSPKPTPLSESNKISCHRPNEGSVHTTKEVEDNYDDVSELEPTRDVPSLPMPRKVSALQQRATSIHRQSFTSSKKTIRPKSSVPSSAVSELSAAHVFELDNDLVGVPYFKYNVSRSAVDQLLMLKCNPGQFILRTNAKEQLVLCVRLENTIEHILVDRRQGNARYSIGLDWHATLESMIQQHLRVKLIAGEPIFSGKILNLSSDIINARQSLP